MKDMNTYESEETYIHTYIVLLWKPIGRDRWEDLGSDGRAVMKWILKKWAGRI